MTKDERFPQSLSVAFEQPKVAADPGSPGRVVASGCLEAYQRELDYLIGSLRRLGVRYPDVEDVLHEVFLVMLRRWEDYDPTRPVRPWLFGITYRVAAANRRKRTREILGTDYEAEDLCEGPDEHLAADQDRALLLRALAQVPIERRAVLIMHEIDETPMRQIAATLEIPLFTAYSRLRKARTELDAALIRLEKGSHRVR
ncbi:MAG: sigma-70 family RNA polymerase sigma factor [Polyangiaceae bacterium]